MSTEQPPTADEAEHTAQAQVVLLIDPAWEASEEEKQPPLHAVLGGWHFDEDGNTERFDPNPHYKPSRPDSPTDPIDATLQIVVKGEADGSELLAAMQNAIFGVAIDAKGDAVVAPAPDDVPSVLVTTAPAHRERCTVAGWVEVGIEELAEALPDRGIDVLLNPGAPASIRIEASWIKGMVDPERNSEQLSAESEA